MTAELPRSAPALPQRRYIFQATTRASYCCDGSLIGWTLAFYVLMASVYSFQPGRIINLSLKLSSVFRERQNEVIVYGEALYRKSPSCHNGIRTPVMARRKGLPCGIRSNYRRS